MGWETVTERDKGQDLSDEQPTHRSSVDALREKIELTGSFTAPWFKGVIKAARDGDAESPSSIGLAMVLLSGAACIPTTVLLLAAGQLRMPGLMVCVLAMASFVIVFGAGITLMLVARNAPAVRRPARLPAVNGSAPLPKNKKPRAKA